MNEIKVMEFFISSVKFLPLIAIVIWIISAMIRKRKNKEILERSEKVNFDKTLFVEGYIWVDEKQKKWALPQKLPFGDNYAVTPETEIYDYTDLIDYEVIFDKKRVVKGGSGFGDAVLNAVTWNTLGLAVITTGKKTTKSKCKNLSIKLTTGVPEHSELYIRLITIETDMTSIVYKDAVKNAEKIVSVLNTITSDNKPDVDVTPKDDKSVESEKTSGVSAADEIKKYKELLDMGAITEEEFDKKKKQLLDL